MTAPIAPERLQGQGLDPHQHESGDRAIAELLMSEQGRRWTDFVATYRHDGAGSGAYEAWALRGMVRWVRHIAPSGGWAYKVVEEIGDNPLGAQDHRALATLEEETAAAGPDKEADSTFVEPEALTYPLAYERISQLFDSPNAPDLVVNPRSWAYGPQPGQHGALDVIQSRAPLILTGPGVKQGAIIDCPARQVDIAPTILHILGAPLIDGRDTTGRTSSERGVSPDVYLARQDGSVLNDALLSEPARAERAIILLLDGQSHTELFHRLTDPAAIPNLRRLVDGGAAFAWGAIANFPSITWPSHNALGTGAWCGHHDIVNPTYYLRESGQTVSPQGQQFETARFLGDGVETLFEAVTRAFGGPDEGVITASINEPCTRGASHAGLERRLLGDREALKQLTAETVDDIDPRWQRELKEFGHEFSGQTDNRALGQARQLLGGPGPVPKLMFIELTLTDSAGHDYGPHHEGTRAALDETDRRIGHILALLDERGLFDSTLFIVTADHGMALQDAAANANPARIPERAGMAAVTTEPFIYLRDLRLEITLAHDGRSGRIEALDNDANSDGEHLPVPSAQVAIVDTNDYRIAGARTDSFGVAGFSLPVDIPRATLRMRVSAEGFNAREVLMNGSAAGPSLRALLFEAGPPG